MTSESLEGYPTHSSIMMSHQTLMALEAPSISLHDLTIQTANAQAYSITRLKFLDRQNMSTIFESLRRMPTGCECNFKSPCSLTIKEKYKNRYTWLEGPEHLPKCHRYCGEPATLRPQPLGTHASSSSAPATTLVPLTTTMQTIKGAQ